jgi:hypothetical protein
MRESIEREVRVAFSPRAQPVWFRIAKWLVFLVVSAVLLRTGYLLQWLLGATLATLAGLGMHFLWRWKTQGWTRAWGGWTDVEAARR